jgi:hypothetical protein
MIRTKIAELDFDSEHSILHIQILENADMCLENAKNHYELIEELTQNTRYVAFVDSSIYFTTTPETMEYTSKKSTFKNRIGTVYYNSVMQNKLTTDFFVKVYKPDMLIKTFKTKEEAFEWWVSVKEQYI